MDQVGIHIYGWVDVGVNGSTSKIANTPQSYDFIPNRPVLDQAVVMIERDPDMVQTQKADWGFVANVLWRRLSLYLCKRLFQQSIA